MKKKTEKVCDFIEGLTDWIANHPHIRKDTINKTEKFIQSELRSMIGSYLENWFKKIGHKNPSKKADLSYYWKGQEGSFGNDRKVTFAARNYPDFIIKSPYLVAVEYIKDPSGAAMKLGIGQSVIHTMSGEFDYVLFLFQDETKDQKIKSSILENSIESKIVDKMCDDFNTFIRFV